VHLHEVWKGGQEKGRRFATLLEWWEWM